MDGGNERVPPICPMLFPLRLSLHSDLWAIVLLWVHGGGWDTMHTTKKYTHTNKRL